MSKELKKRSASEIVRERDRQLTAEANEWARSETRRWFDEHKSGFYTPSDILEGLDERRDAPAAWLRWLGDYNTRYQMVRNALVSMAKRELLETRDEYNALNRPATAYQRASDLDAWTVKVEGEDIEGVTELVLEWLRERKRALKGIRAIAISRGT